MFLGVKNRDLEEISCNGALHALWGPNMSKWVREIEPKDEDTEETEVHRFSTELLLINVHKEKGEKLWSVTVMHAIDCSLACPETYEEDLTKAQVIALTKCMELLERDGKILVSSMEELVGPKQQVEQH